MFFELLEGSAAIAVRGRCGAFAGVGEEGCGGGFVFGVGFGAGFDLQGGFEIALLGNGDAFDALDGADGIHRVGGGRWGNGLDRVWWWRWLHALHGVGSDGVRGWRWWRGLDGVWRRGWLHALNGVGRDGICGWWWRRWLHRVGCGIFDALHRWWRDGSGGGWLDFLDAFNGFLFDAFDAFDGGGGGAGGFLGVGEEREEQEGDAGECANAGMGRG